MSFPSETSLGVLTAWMAGGQMAYVLTFVLSVSIIGILPMIADRLGIVTRELVTTR